MNPYQTANLVAGAPKEGNPRETEAWALSESGRRMALAARGERKEMREALRLNWRLWTIFQADISVTAEQQEAPDPVLLKMLTLCQFIDKHTVAALADPTPEKLQVLVDINRNIASGMRQSLVREEREQAVSVAAAAAGPVLETRAVG